MQIKRFEAQDMAEALKMVKREFGPQAVILSARDINKRRGLLGLLRCSGVEVTAATDPNGSNGTVQNEDFPRRKWTLQKQPVEFSGSKNRNIPSIPRPKRFQERSAVRSVTHYGTGKPVLQQKDHLIEVLNAYEELVSQGVDEAIASTLVDRIRGEFSTGESRKQDRSIKERLKDALKEMTAPAQRHPSCQGTPKVIALVGPAGVGKTTTLAKMAVRETFENKRDIALITLNDHRIGAAAQMDAYGKILDVPTAAVSDVNEFIACLKRFRDKDVILVDTPGISHNDIFNLNELKSLLSAADFLEVHLLTAAGTREKDFENIFRKFRMLPVDMLLFTKIDETGEYGSMINAVFRTKLPVSYLTNGQQIPENMESGSIDRIVDLVWKERKKRDQSPNGSVPCDFRNHSAASETNSDEEVYVANKNSDLFHHPDCKWVERISERNLRVFKSQAEAVANNFHPCRACQSLFTEQRFAPSLPLQRAPYEGIRETGGF